MTVEELKKAIPGYRNSIKTDTLETLIFSNEAQGTQYMVFVSPGKQSSFGYYIFQQFRKMGDVM
jgi:hypothetical protein